jgi:FdhE protein
MFMANLARAQQAALDTHPAVTAPDETQLRRCRQHGLPPLSISGWRREPVWRHTLQTLLSAVRAEAPPATRAVIDRASSMSEQELEAQADALLAHNHMALDLGAAPFIGAALQVYWSRLATGLDVSVLPPPDPATVCPVCGSLPVASVIRVGPDHGLRYLCCSLCATEWHMVRVKCAHCESTKGIGYYTIEAANAPSLARGPRLDPIGEAANAPSLARGPRLDPIGEAANAPDQISGRTSEASRASASARGPADAQDARMPRRPGMAESGLGPIGDGGTPAIRAESCDECHSYVKAFYMDKDSGVEAVADDLASIALDLLMADAGYERAGANLLLIPGEAADAPSLARGPRLDPIGEAADAPSLARGPRLDPIGEAADAPSLARGPRLDPIGEAADAPNQTSGRTSEASRASISARGPADAQDARMPRRPGMAESGLDPIDEAATPPPTS